MYDNYEKTFHAPCSALKNILPDTPFDEYKKMSGLNYHGLKNFYENPMLWKAGWFDERPETRAMKFGTMAHVWLLQGDEAFGRRYATWTPPVNPKTGSPFGAETKAYKEALLEWHAANPGKEPVSEETLDLLGRMRAETGRNPSFSRFFRSPDEPGAHSEVIFRGPLDGVPELILKGAIDRYDDEFGIIDLKTTQTLDKRFWKYTVEDRGYIDQLAFYQIAVHDVCGSEKYPGCFIAAIETGGQLRSGIQWIDPRIMERAREKVLHEMVMFAVCVKEGNFPGPFDKLLIRKSYMGDAADE